LNRALYTPELVVVESRRRVKMPPPQAIPEELRAEVERRIMTEKQPHSQVLEWLANEGYPCSAPTLKRQCQKWGISRRGLAADPFVVGYIDD
jgi:hypothetical protein